MERDQGAGAHGNPKEQRNAEVTVEVFEPVLETPPVFVQGLDVLLEGFEQGHQTGQNQEPSS
ncbi:MAG: hypothetical protein OXD50_01095 [Chloroflexi bacterium]|nr:hypothetical protein [Chloroflexota bacterium]